MHHLYFAFKALPCWKNETLAGKQHILHEAQLKLETYTSRLLGCVSKKIKKIKQKLNRYVIGGRKEGRKGGRKEGRKEWTGGGKEGRKEGRKEGTGGGKEGRTEGMNRREGRKEGRKEGREEGRNEQEEEKKEGRKEGTGGKEGKDKGTKENIFLVKRKKQRHA